MDIYGIIYKIENLVNHKVYIGLTTRSFNKRYSANGVGIERVYNYYTYQDKNNQFVNRHLLNSIEKYGFENFKVDEVFDVAYSQEELKDKEKYWINYYNSTNINKGYNKTEGGDSFLKGKDNPKFTSIEVECEYCGKKIYKTPYRINRSEHNFCCSKCKTSYYKGKESSLKDNVVVKCDFCGKEINRPKSLINKHNYCDEECKNKHQKIINKGGNNPNSKKVMNITTQKIFDTLTDAGNYYNICRQNISKCCRGKAKSCGGYEWKFI